MAIIAVPPPCSSRSVCGRLERRFGTAVWHPQQYAARHRCIATPELGFYCDRIAETWNSRRRQEEQNLVHLVPRLIRKSMRASLFDGSSQSLEQLKVHRYRSCCIRWCRGEHRKGSLSLCTCCKAALYSSLTTSFMSCIIRASTLANKVSASSRREASVSFQGDSPSLSMGQSGCAGSADSVPKACILPSDLPTSLSPTCSRHSPHSPPCSTNQAGESILCRDPLRSDGKPLLLSVIASVVMLLTIGLQPTGAGAVPEPEDQARLGFPCELASPATLVHPDSMHVLSDCTSSRQSPALVGTRGHEAPGVLLLGSKGASFLGHLKAPPLISMNRLTQDTDGQDVIVEVADAGGISPAPGSEPSSPPSEQGTAVQTHSNMPSEGDTFPAPASPEFVVLEVWKLVDESFLDARHKGWDADKWEHQDVLKRPIRSKTAAYNTIKNMLGSLNDPYTRFLSPDQFAQLSKYDITGIGLNIGEDADPSSGRTVIKVIGLVIGSPAEVAGVQQGDELLSVNEERVEGRSAFEAASLIQGPKGSLVTLTLRSPGAGATRQVVVKRQGEVTSPVQYKLAKMSGEDVGYIRIGEFNALALQDLMIAMQRLEAKGAKSYILDLQDNPGGLVQAGIEVAKLFLEPESVVVHTVGRDPSSFKSVVTKQPAFSKAPLMLMVNSRTASASEIVAAALHDNCRAVLIGRRTYGKGLIQSVYELSDGSGVVLTVGKYVTPSRNDIDGNGIEPDFRNTPSFAEAMDHLTQCRSSGKGAQSAGVGKPKEKVAAALQLPAPLL
ncbi:hypothetical protein CBR_g38981 [Chara braunii]|uniref:C-terminal processing peptidase n=1 Tax=Chara braunii TaxID=69332 RepID=A0A388K0U9_CHABU|nr:hypothetical protein CBR_g38981 [Chara braunii]|eukprot:GBG63669.1 hypothetical protein CBR_g38981 [Chara braunii]